MRLGEMTRPQVESLARRQVVALVTTRIGESVWWKIRPKIESRIATTPYYQIRDWAQYRVLRRAT